MEGELSYEECVRSFDDSLTAATVVSRAAAGHTAEPRAWWASVLFARLCTMGVSLLVMLPGSRIVVRALENWDFAAIASLVRNLIECYLTFFYLCIESVSDDEWHCRLNLFNLHDCISRMRMFRDFDPTDKDLPNFQRQAEELRRELRGNQFFQSLPEKRQDQLLRGRDAYLISRNILVERIGESPNHFRAIYRFLSSQVHTLPMSFYRMADQERGRGLENDIEKGYISSTLEFVSPYIRRATREMITLFQEAEESLNDQLHSVVFGNEGKT